MSWRIPPIGYCAVCTAEQMEEEESSDPRPALALWQGTGLCRAHLREVTR